MEVEEILTDEEIKLLDCELAISDFYYYCQYMDPEFFTDGKWHLKKVAYKLQQLLDKKTKNLIILMPFRSGKSYLVSLFCSWLIGKFPTKSIMRNSYGQDTANKFSYDIRAIIQFPRYLELFPHVILKKDKQNITDWSITEAKQSTYFCAGFEGGITGKGCDLFAIVDDPVKNIEDALSETVLEKTWNLYTTGHRGRMEDGCKEIIIATRYSVNDLVGKILEKESDRWEVITIPALDENGKSFCEEIKTTEDYLREKALLDPMFWEATYMQNPVEIKGLLFTDLNYFNLNELHDYDVVVGYTDIADEGTDYLCSLIGKMKDERCYITDVIFTQLPIEETEPLVAQMIIDTGCDEMTFESNNGGKSYALNIEKLIKTKSRCSIEWHPNTTNKETRIIMKSGQIKKFFYFRNDYETGSDYDLYMKNLKSYKRMGKNKHDDAPDATTGLAERILIPQSIEFLTWEK